MKKYFLTLLLVFGVFLSSFSQYMMNQYYAVRGENRTEVSYRNEYNYYTQTYQVVRYCRQINWQKQYYSGNVYYYNPVYGTWYTQWQSGHFWYCYWSNWYRC